MKHALIIIALASVCLAADKPAEEWKVVRGEWEQPKPQFLRTDFGIIEYQGPAPPDNWRLSMNVTILSWKNPTGGLVGISWGAQENTVGLFLAQRAIRLIPMSGNPCKPIDLSWVPPVKRRIAVAIKITSGGIEGIIGGERVRLESSAHPEKLRLVVNGADAIFDSVSLK